MWSQTPQWLQASHYQNVPHNQVDWASLAKQWISMQQQPQIPLPPSAPLPPPTVPLPPPPLQTHSYSTEELQEAPDEEPLQEYWNQDSQGINSNEFYNRNVHSPHRSAVGGQTNQYSAAPFIAQPQRQVVDYAHNPSGPPRPSGVVMDYGHGGDGVGHAERCVVDYGHGFGQNTSSAAPTPPLVAAGAPTMNAPVSVDSNMAIDAMKRKNLPAWIREGLEKMEREKQRKKEAEERQKKAEEKKQPLWTQEDGDEATKESSVPQKEQESDEELPDDEAVVKESSSPERKEHRKSDSTPPQIFLTQEEKEIQFTANVKRFLTEILLSVMTTELDSIVQDEIRRARNRVTARPKKVTSALANIVGIGGYSDSDASDNEDRPKDDGGDSESDLEARITSRRREFQKWEQSMLSSIEERENNLQKRIRGDIQESPPRRKSRSNTPPSRSREREIHDDDERDRSESKERSYSDKRIDRDNSNDSESRSSRSKDARRRKNRYSSSSDSEEGSRSRRRKNSSRKGRRKSRSRDRSRKRRSSSSRSSSRSYDRRRGRSGSRDRRQRSRSRDRRRDRSRERYRSRSESRDRRRDRSRSYDYKKSSYDRKYDRGHKRR